MLPFQDKRYVTYCNIGLFIAILLIESFCLFCYSAALLPYSWFLWYLNFANGWISVFLRFYFHEWVCQKLSNVMGGSFFKGLNFTNEQHPQNSWNLRTSKNQLYGIPYSMEYSDMVLKIHITIQLFYYVVVIGLSAQKWCYLAPKHTPMF